MWEYFAEKIDVGHSKDFYDDGSDVLKYVEKLNVFLFFLPGKQNKLRVYYLSWLKAKILKGEEVWCFIQSWKQYFTRSKTLHCTVGKKGNFVHEQDLLVK